MPTPPRTRRRILRALAAAVLGAAGGIAVALATPVAYTATGTVFVSTPQGSTTLLEQSGYAQQVRSSYASLVTTPVVLQPVIDRLRLDTSAGALAARISVTSPADTVLVDIGVHDASAARAVRIENAVQDRLVDLAPSLTPVRAGSAPSVAVTAVKRPTSAPSGPAPVVVVLAGALAGVLIWAIVVAVVRIRRRPPRPPAQTAPSVL